MALCVTVLIAATCALVRFVVASNNLVASLGVDVFTTPLHCAWATGSAGISLGVKILSTSKLPGKLNWLEASGCL